VCCEKQLKSSSDDGDCGSKTCRRGYSGAYSVVWRCLWETEIRLSDIGYSKLRKIQRAGKFVLCCWHRFLLFHVGFRCNNVCALIIYLMVLLI
jgi:hypothetical protein